MEDVNLSFTGDDTRPQADANFSSAVVTLCDSFKQNTLIDQLAEALELHLKQSSCEQLMQNEEASLQYLFVTVDHSYIDQPVIQDKLKRLLSAYADAVKICFLSQASERGSWKPSDYQLLSYFDDLIFLPCNLLECIARCRRLETVEQDTMESDLLLGEHFKRFNLFGKSQVFIETLNQINKVAKCTEPVLIQGESGTGKENTARAIHYLSARKDCAFVPINCGALPDQLLESELFGYEKGAFTDAKKSQPGLLSIANGGTLFLDEVDSLSAKAQVSLLRFLQTKEYRPLGGREIYHADVCIVAASNADLNMKVTEHKFREDLLFRLNVLNIQIPPLRMRGADVVLIAKCFLRTYAEKNDMIEKKLSPSAAHWLQYQPWPGNVRELENFLLRQILLNDGESISLACCTQGGECTHHTPPVSDEELNFKNAKASAIANFEITYIKSILQLTEGNVSKASRLSGKERRAFGKMLKKYNIDKDVYCH